MIPRFKKTHVVTTSLLAIVAGCIAEAEVTGSGLGRAPPFFNTTELVPEIITDQDPTAYTGLTSNGQGSRTMFDRRVGDFITVDAFLFDATYDDGLAIEVQVNPEFGDVAAAQAEADKYAEAIGRIPTALRAEVRMVWIHRGFQLFGSGDGSLLIHADQGELFRIDGFLEEVFVHEAVHTSLDSLHAQSPGWLEAQAADNWFISNVARDFPAQEDLAESVLVWIAVRFRSDRLNSTTEALITQTIPNRMAYLDALMLDLHPIQ